MPVKFEQIPIKNKQLWIFEGVINQTQFGNSVTNLASILIFCFEHKMSYISFSSLLMKK